VTYSGALAEPLRPRMLRSARCRARLHGPAGGPIATSALDGQSQASTEAAWRWEYDLKLPLLLKHFEIPNDHPDRWHLLSLKLAIAHVPGFQVKVRRKAGRKKSMPTEKEAALYARFSALQKQGQSERNATRLMMKEMEKPDFSEAGLLRRMQRYAETHPPFHVLLTRPIWSDIHLLQIGSP